jgi:hypothetical protein
MPAIFHVKSNTIGDFTGTVTVMNSAGSTATANATDLVRPVDWNSGHRFAQTIAGNTAGQSTGAGTNFVYGGTNGVTLSISTGADINTIWFSAGGGGAAPQQSFFWGMVPGMSTAVSQVGNGTIAVYPVMREGGFTATRANIWASLSVSSSSNSSHAGALSIHVGLYTRNGSTLSLASSGSQSYQWTNTSNNSLGSIASLRQLTIPIDVNYTGGDLWIAVMSRSSTTNANWFTGSNVLQSVNPHSGQVVGNIGEATNATRGVLGLGRFSASSSVLPASMAFSNITGGLGGTASASRLMPNVYFANFTA